jgi:hypothetical protein
MDEHELVDDSESIYFDAPFAPLPFIFAFGPLFFRFCRLRNLSIAACSTGSVMGSAMTYCNGAILHGAAAFLDMAHSSYGNTV